MKAAHVAERKVVERGGKQAGGGGQIALRALLGGWSGQ